ncbi:hypothetical protein ILUMI_05580 [Ignelater luminosus]|uniref:Uncharacterized protein n=1 Tax=Ignelater luminosus TaxID=2038154 RepID=A0A8K0DAU3_IGNLU|nr:hypothetical protein ILUMI_05580 [Ignelater luminosus]
MKLGLEIQFDAVNVGTELCTRNVPKDVSFSFDNMFNIKPIIQFEVKIVQGMAASTTTTPAPRHRRSHSAGEVWLNIM